MKLLVFLGSLVASAAVAQSLSSQPAPTPAPQPGFERSRPAAATQRPCLTPDEARGLATFVLPSLIDGLAERCRGRLGRDAYLRSDDAAALARRLRADGAESWPVARGAIEKLNGSRLPTFLGDRFLRTTTEGAAAGIVLKDFDRADCAGVDGLVAGLAPLPSTNFSGVIASLIALGGERAGAEAPLRICPAPPAR